MPRKTDVVVTHDAYGRVWLEDLVVADAIFRGILPWDIVCLLAGLPVRYATELVNERGRVHRTDMQFVYELKGGGQLLLVVEFKSSREATAAWQLLKYQVTIYELHSTGEDGRFKGLPLVYFLVLHNGPRQWRKRPDIKSLIKGNRVVQAITGAQAAEPGFDLQDTKRLVPLLDHNPKAQAGCLAMTIGGKGKPSVKELEDLFRMLPANSRFERQTLEYIVFQCMEVIDRVDVAFQTIQDERGTKMLIDETKSKVLHKLHAEGKAEGKAEVLAKLLNLKFGRVPANAQRKIKQASPAELDAWAGSVLTAGSLKEVFAAS
ncbi:MAG: Rpn family recombination-promoting nuclease/putative transposase [Pseudomonadales bacterium]